ncbi:MAG: hypothetical protein KBD31_01140 [Proteobacteria bacterium]|nr:hypothetical protein [Pseudomonadota bacterium]
MVKIFKKAIFITAVFFAVLNFTNAAAAAETQDQRQNEYMIQRIETVLFQNLTGSCLDDTRIGDVDIYSALENALPDLLGKENFLDLVFEATHSFNQKVTRLSAIDPTKPKNVLVLGATPYDGSILNEITGARLSLIEKADFLDKRLFNEEFPLIKEKTAHHFFQIDMNSPEFMIFAKSPQQYQTIMFDWCVLNCVSEKQAPFIINNVVLENIYEKLAVGGDLFLSDVYDSDLKSLNVQLVMFGFEVKVLTYQQLSADYQSFVFMEILQHQTPKKPFIVAKKITQNLTKLPLADFITNHLKESNGDFDYISLIRDIILEHYKVGEHVFEEAIDNASGRYFCDPL